MEEIVNWLFQNVCEDGEKQYEGWKGNEKRKPHRLQNEAFKKEHGENKGI